MESLEVTLLTVRLVKLTRATSLLALGYSVSLSLNKGIIYLFITKNGSSRSACFSLPGAVKIFPLPKNGLNSKVSSFTAETGVTNRPKAHRLPNKQVTTRLT